MRCVLVIILALTLASCVRIERNTSQMTTPEQILQRSSHVFIGVIEKHDIMNRVLFRVSGADGARWVVVRMRVRVELVLRGTEPHSAVDIYEAFPTGGLSGDWNNTQDNRRYLFPVRRENNRYHLARDFWRSIYPVNSGRHERLPLDDSRPLWERVALLQWWVQPDRSRAFGDDRYTDPARLFGQWREAKVLRGLLRYPDRDVRLIACEDLLHMSMAQDECWDELKPADRQSLNKFWNMVPPQDSWNENRRFESDAHPRWDEIIRAASLSPDVVNELRLFTTINNSKLRGDFCAKFQKKFPQDTENGCPADRSPPATIVTLDGDVPLKGAWPNP